MLKLRNIEEQINSEEEIISALKAQEMLNSNISELESLCRKTSLRPRKDEFGNVYFSRGDVEILKKVKELYTATRQIQEQKEENYVQETTSSNIFARARARVKAEVREVQEIQQPQKTQLQETEIQPEEKQAAISRIENTLSAFENNIVEKINNILSEKMDGLDEVVLELIRSKTELESLRQKLNDANKENYALKKEILAYKPFGFGLYVKNNRQEF